MTRRRVIAGLALAVCLLTSAFAGAHDFPVERSLLVQVGKAEVEMMLVYAEPPGERTDLLLAKFDLDNDEALSANEAKLAEGELSRRAFHGVSLELLGEKPGMHPPEMKVRRTSDGGLAAAFFIRYELDPAIDFRVFVVRLAGAADSVVPLALIVEEGDGIDVIEATTPLGNGAIEPTELRGGALHWTRFRVSTDSDGESRERSSTK